MSNPKWPLVVEVSSSGFVDQPCLQNAYLLGSEFMYVCTNAASEADLLLRSVFVLAV